MLVSQLTTDGALFVSASTNLPRPLTTRSTTLAAFTFGGRATTARRTELATTPGRVVDGAGGNITVLCTTDAAFTPGGRSTTSRITEVARTLGRPAGTGGFSGSVRRPGSPRSGFQ